MAEVASYDHQSVSIKREEDGTPLDELLSRGSPQLSRVREERGPFLYSTSLASQEDQRPRVVVPCNDLPVSDMDLAGFLDMDDKTLSGNYCEL